MINHHRAFSTVRGFTLFETIIYLALFSILFTGVLASAYTFLTGAERLSTQILKENESAFVIAKLSALLNSANKITSPVEGGADTSLSFSTYAGDTYSFSVVGAEMTLSNNSSPAWPLTSERIAIADFFATHTAPTATLPRYVEYVFSVDGEVVGPMRMYFTF